MAAPSLRKTPSNAIIFTLIRRGADDEKKTFEGPTGKPVVDEEYTIVGPYVQPPSRAQRMFKSSTGVKSEGLSQMRAA